MLERSILRDHFDRIHATCQDAASAYETLAAEAGDDGARTELTRLSREQARHVELCQRLLEIVDE
jgi:rubrerythrin